MYNILTENDKDEEEIRLWLQNHREPWPDVQAAWKKCSGKRLQEIKSSTLTDLIKRWPIYKHAYAHSLVRNNVQIYLNYFINL